MAQVYLDVNIGDAAEAASAEEAFAALNAHFQAHKSQLGIKAAEDLSQLDDEARELITESFRRNGSDQVHRAYNKSTVQECDSTSTIDITFLGVESALSNRTARWSGKWPGCQDAMLYHIDIRLCAHVACLESYYSDGLLTCSERHVGARLEPP